MAGVVPGRGESAVSDLDALRRLAVIGVLLAVAIGIVSMLAAFAAFGWDFEAAAFGHPEAILGRGREAALLFRWAFLGDMFYSYLLLVPLALFLHRRLRERRPWLADLGLAAALAYIFLGGAGAAILATAGSSLIEAYAAAAPADRPAIATSYELVRDIVYFALWQTLDAITLSTWMFSVGWAAAGRAPPGGSAGRRPLRSRALAELDLAPYFSIRPGRPARGPDARVHCARGYRLPYGN